MKSILSATLFALILLPQPAALSAATAIGITLPALDLTIDRRSGHCPKGGIPSTSARCRGV